jgi:phage terminase Nu1 subunit (DNA packaging protein)
MTTTELAKRLGTGRAAVLRAIKAEIIPPAAVRWVGKRGKRRHVEIVDPDLAMRSWAPRTPSAKGEETIQPLGDESTTSDARRHFEIARARREQLEFESEASQVIKVDVAMGIYTRQIAEAKNAVMAIGRHARSRLPHLTVDDVATIDQLAREALEGLAARAIVKPARKGRRS